MTIIELEVPDDKMVPKVVQACKMLIGVSSVKVQRKEKTKTRIYDPETGEYLNDEVVKAIEEAHDDMKHGRLKTYHSVDDMYNDLGISV